MKTKVATDIWPNGQKRYEIPYVNGKRHGLDIWWHINGKKWHEIPYVNGKRHDLEVEWYPNEQKQRETPYVNGQIYGLVTRCFSDGSLSNFQKWHQDQWVWGV